MPPANAGAAGDGSGGVSPPDAGSDEVLMRLLDHVRRDASSPSAAASVESGALTGEVCRLRFEGSRLTADGGDFFRTTREVLDEREVLAEG